MWGWGAQTLPPCCLHLDPGLRRPPSSQENGTLQDFLRSPPSFPLTSADSSTAPLRKQRRPRNQNALKQGVALRLHPVLHMFRQAPTCRLLLKGTTLRALLKLISIKRRRALVALRLRRPQPLRIVKRPKWQRGLQVLPNQSLLGAHFSPALRPKRCLSLMTRPGITMTMPERQSAAIRQESRQERVTRHEVLGVYQTKDEKTPPPQSRVAHRAPSLVQLTLEVQQGAQGPCWKRCLRRLL